MNKRAAAWSLLQVLTIVGGIMAALLLVAIVYRFTSQERGELTFYAMDSAMLTDAVLAAPQDVQLIYPKEFTKWDLRLGNSSISFFPSQPEPNSSSIYTNYFIPRKDIAIKEGDVMLSALFFIKENAIFMIDNKPAMKIVAQEVENSNAK
jgi:hypothetical protein